MWIFLFSLRKDTIVDIIERSIKRGLSNLKVFFLMYRNDLKIVYLYVRDRDKDVKFNKEVLVFCL